jgi:hypothetical protein
MQKTNDNQQCISFKWIHYKHILLWQNLDPRHSKEAWQRGNFILFTYNPFAQS